MQLSELKKYRTIKTGIRASLILILLLSFANVKGVHVSGGSIHWKTIAKGDSLEIDVITYADCNGTVYNDGNLYLKSTKKSSTFTNLKIKSTRFISNICRSYCTPCTSSSCANKVGFQEIIYTKKVKQSDYIDSKNCRLDISYSDCCRPGTFTTADSRNKTFTISAWVDFCKSPNDSSPLLNDSLVQTFFIGRVGLDFSMTDVDNDSLNYFIDSVSNVSWKKGFNSENPFTGTLKINKQSGILAVLARRIELSAIGVKVSSFQNGVIVSETRREYPYIIYARSTPDYVLDSLSVTGFNRHLIALEGDTFRMNWSTKTEISISSEIDSSYFKNISANKIKMEFVPTSKDLGHKKILFNTNNQLCPYYFKNSQLLNLWIIDKKDTSFKIIQQKNREECGSFKFSVPNKFDAYWKDIDWYVNDTFSHSGRVYSSNLTKTDTTKIKIVFKIGSHQFSDSIIFIPNMAPNALLTLAPIKLDSICADSLIIKMNATGGNGSNRYNWYVENFPWYYAQELKIDFSNISIPTNIRMAYRVTDSEGCLVDGVDTFKVIPFAHSNIQNDSTLCDSGAYNFRLKSPTPGGIWSGPFVIDSNLFEGNNLGFKNKATLTYKNNNPKYCLTDEAEFKLRKSARLTLSADSIACIGNDPIAIKTNLLGGVFKSIGIDTSMAVPYFTLVNSVGIKNIIYEYTNSSGCISTDTTFIKVLSDTIKAPIIDSNWCFSDSKTRILPANSIFETWTGKLVDFDDDKNIYSIKFPNDTSIKQLDIEYFEARSNGCRLSENYSIALGRKETFSFNATSEICEDNKLELIATTLSGKWQSKFVTETGGRFFFKLTESISKDSVFNVIYSYTDMIGCTTDSNKNVEVWPRVKIGLNNREFNICETSDSLMLPLPADDKAVHIWTGPGVVQKASYYVVLDLSASLGSTQKYIINASKAKSCSNADSLELTTFHKVNAQFTQDSTFGKAPAEISFWATDADYIKKYKWIGLENDLDTTNSRFTNYMFSKAGIYDIGLKVYGDMDVCTDSVYKLEHINISPNSIKTNFTSSIQAFPNPTLDKTLISSKETIYSLELYDSKGALIHTEKPNAKTLELSLKGLNNGHYMARVLILKNGELSQFNMKISKQ